MKPIYLNMPVGDHFGWAICGKNIVNELSKIADVKYIVDGFEYGFRDQRTIEKMATLEAKVKKEVNAPFIHTIDNNFKGVPLCKGKPNTGYMFYEDSSIPDDGKSFLKDNYDFIIAGSTWNKEILEAAGIKAISIIQGIDHDIFNPQEQTIWKDTFTIFSAGKFEQRKAQDIVLEAVSVMQKRHKDVCLVALWNNLFMPDLFKEYIAQNIHKIDMARAMFLPIVDQYKLAKIMNNTTIGVFPNRVEGGTNLVLMEYLACGKPVVANYATGQKDVLRTGYAYYADKDRLLDSTIEQLEYAYNHRDELMPMGKAARTAMQQYTWAKTAREFYNACYSN